MVGVPGWTHRLLSHPVQYYNTEYTKHSRTWWVFLGGPTTSCHTPFNTTTQNTLNTPGHGGCSWVDPPPPVPPPFNTTTQNTLNTPTHCGCSWVDPLPSVAPRSILQHRIHSHTWWVFLGGPTTSCRTPFNTTTQNTLNTPTCGGCSWVDPPPPAALLSVLQHRIH